MRPAGDIGTGGVAGLGFVRYFVLNILFWVVFGLISFRHPLMRVVLRLLRRFRLLRIRRRVLRLPANGLVKFLLSRQTVVTRVRRVVRDHVLRLCVTVLIRVLIRVEGLRKRRVRRFQCQRPFVVGVLVLRDVLRAMLFRVFRHLANFHLMPTAGVTRLQNYREGFSRRTFRRQAFRLRRHLILLMVLHRILF